MTRAGGPRRIGGARDTVNLSGAGGKRMISWAQRWRLEAARLAGAGADLLFPPRCRWCRFEGDALHAGLCERCRGDFIETRARCPRCGFPSVAAAHCCPRGPTVWEGIVVLGGYADELRDAVLRMKRPGAENLALSLATLLAEKHRAVLDAVRPDAIVPVPMHWWRRAGRGTSAADEIARGVVASRGGRFLPALFRVRPTRMQNELPPEDRAANVADAFRVRRDVAARRLLVIDDVVTTGATLAACCHALRAAGAATVHVAALAKADRMADAAGGGEDR